jgi:hypothetical protein
LPRELASAIRGVVLGPRDVDPIIRAAVWEAWAAGPKGERIEGEGDFPEQALLALAAKLAPLRGKPSG